jgi:hypothetical protein
MYREAEELKNAQKAINQALCQQEQEQEARAKGTWKVRKR